MDELFELQEQYLTKLPNERRYLLNDIDWSNRLIAIKGARGTGKTTLLFQYIKYKLEPNEEPLYASLDHLFFLENNLVDLAKDFTHRGGTILLLDEVHKYPRWSREIKLLYDQFPSLKIIFTSSSMLEIYKGESDLSRRVVTYHLNELSYREYVDFSYGNPLPKVTLEELLKYHKEIAKEVKSIHNLPLKSFNEYLDYGAYPFYLEGKEAYLGKLKQTINLIVETDMNVVENITYLDSIKIMKLLIAVAQSAPFTPNISKLSSRLGFNRTFLLNSLKLLDKAGLVMELYRPTTGIGALTKPEKLFLQNSNIIKALNPTADKGTIRETFFVNQVRLNHKIHLAEKGDFLVNRKYTFEIGGKNKDSKQIQGLSEAYVVKDDIEIGGLNIIPLYLFGLLY